MDYVRPKTRGELMNYIKSGVACEVASHIAEMTSIMLKYWLNTTEFKVRPSENKGWSVFEVIKND